MGVSSMEYGVYCRTILGSLAHVSCLCCHHPVHYINQLVSLYLDQSASKVLVPVYLVKKLLYITKAAG